MLSSLFMNRFSTSYSDICAICRHLPYSKGICSLWIFHEISTFDASFLSQRVTPRWSRICSILAIQSMSPFLSFEIIIPYYSNKNGTLMFNATKNSCPLGFDRAAVGLSAWQVERSCCGVCWSGLENGMRTLRVWKNRKMKKTPLMDRGVFSYSWVFKYSSRALLMTNVFEMPVRFVYALNLSSSSGGSRNVLDGQSFLFLLLLMP